MIVIDDVMGAGKTSYMIEYINKHPELSYVYCTPLLNEVARIKRSCPNSHFQEPIYENGGRKIDSFNKLLESGENIVLTHSTFANATDDTLKYIRDSNYVLIMDETLNTLENFNTVCSDDNQRVKKQDIKMLIEQKFISVDDYGRVSWITNSYSGGKFSDVERMAKNGTLLFLDGAMLVWQFPAQIFDLFKEVVVLTYLFEGSILKPYFQYHGIDFTMKSIGCVNGHYYLTDYRYNAAAVSEFKKLIEIYNDNKANDYRNQSLSKNWFSKNKDKLIKLQNYMYGYFHNKKKVKAKDVLWTCPKEFKDTLQKSGYIKIRKLTAEERKLPKTEQEKIEKQLSCFVSCNIRATNDYNTRSVLAYCINLYMNPYIKKYFEKKNIKDGLNIEVNEDLFALGCMVQWIFRSRIRNSQPISVYIPSTRMRLLFKNWLDNNILT